MVLTIICPFVRFTVNMNDRFRSDCSSCRERKELLFRGCFLYSIKNYFNGHSFGVAIERWLVGIPMTARRKKRWAVPFKIPYFENMAEQKKKGHQHHIASTRYRSKNRL